MKENWGKRGQVTIFIIIGIMIVIVGVLIYMFYPQIKSTFSTQETNPEMFIQNCIEDELKENIEIISLQGGNLEPEHFIMYQGEQIEYLCYTEENYKTCIIQQPMLKNHIEEEIKNSIEDSMNFCFEDMKKSYENQGYGVNIRKGNFEINLLPKKIQAIFNTSVSLTKEDTKTYDSISVVVNNNLYELVSIANSILSWETRYGDAETTTYMDYYRDMKIEKLKQSDSSTIYIITDRSDGSKFQFASRSIPWPAGYP
ncbi:hypothetical protein K9L16_01490 [Candidatus Pacearchaeota archaeon]|nr:hypothetical protein [Candidatus Pacearchaeota archaeon]